MHRLTRNPATNDRGLVLLVTVIMIFILLIMAITFFAMTSYETRQATYRDESSAAFSLADAGVERTRGEFLADGKWRADLTGVALGNGTYDLYVADSTYNGDNAIYIYSEGHVDRADRAVEVWAEGDDGTPPLWAGNNIDGDQGNLCLDGWAHANNDADFGRNDSHLNGGSCDGVGDYSDGEVIRPPIMYTEPANYPGATYYFVNYVPAVGPNPAFAEILDAAGNVLDLGDDLSTQIKVTGGNVAIEFVNQDLETYFDPSTGIFRPLGGDSTVVLNFAERPMGGVLQPNPGGYVTVGFQARAQDPSINAMIINSHYKGTSGNVDDRWKSPNWEGGTLSVGGSTTFEPKQGISALADRLDQSQAGTQLGTEAYPAMTYITGDVNKISGDLSITGALMALNDIVIHGGIQITFIEDFEDAFPPYLDYVVFGQAVALDIFVWREVPADTR
jgi:hypothetical protein